MAGDQPTAEEQAAHEAEDAALRTLIASHRAPSGPPTLTPPPLAEPEAAVAAPTPAAPAPPPAPARRAPTGTTTYERMKAAAHTEPVLVLFETWTQHRPNAPLDDILLNSEEVEIPANHMWMDKYGDGVRTLYDGHLWFLYPEECVRGTDAIYKALRYVDVEGTQLQPLS